MALVSKKAPTTTSQIIKVNPYENPENVMEMMAKICSATASSDDEKFRDIALQTFWRTDHKKGLWDFLYDHSQELLNESFRRDFLFEINALVHCLNTHENTSHTQIVVAGGFSSGKSSFLNRLTNSTGLLPTGVEPVSVVKTYLYCSQHTRSISVRGVNQKNVLVNLEAGVLQAIQHGKQSNVYLASVLEKLFVEIPSKELDGLVFIDTPGYNNSDRLNASNGKTDRSTAQEAFSEGNVLFWLVDCERGTIMVDDIEMIKSFEGKKVFVFNKADKKGKAECQKIIAGAATTLFKEFPKEEIIDILAFSTLDNEIYASYHKKTLAAILKVVKQEGNGQSEMQTALQDIEELFDKEIEACDNAIVSKEQEFKEEQARKEEYESDYREVKDRVDDLIQDIKKIAVINYNEILEAARKIADSSSFAYDKFVDFFNGVIDFECNDHWGSSRILTRAIERASDNIDCAAAKHDAAVDYSYYNAHHRETLIKQIKDMLDVALLYHKEWYEKVSDRCELLLESIKEEKALKKGMIDYRSRVMSDIYTAIKQFQKMKKASHIACASDETPNVFASIQRDDYKAFLRSFENGVDLAICNAEGYSPLTLAVKYGNNAMVKFLLQHNANPALHDKRGYNAFHTAVEHQYRDLCAILLDADPDLMDTTTQQGETIAQLAQKQSFARWIEEEINHSY